MITSAEYVSSAVDLASCPKPIYPEYAFIGRSNVGKSSLINMLVNRKGLAKTSGTPGKTRAINHFIINKDAKPWYLVDLPGYGYAKLSKTQREKFERFIRNYLMNRENLICTCVLVDMRHPPQKIDLEFMEWMGEKGLPFALIFTKCDKLTKNEVVRAFTEYEEAMLRTWVEMPNYFLTSADNRLGRDELTSFIESTNELYRDELLRG